VAVEQYRALQRAAAASDFPEAARSVAVLRNVLLRVPAFREDLLAIRTPAELIADPFDRFLSLPASTSKPSPADLALTFSPESVPGATSSSAVLSFSSNGTDRPAIFAADGREVRRLTTPNARLPFPGGNSAAAPSANSMLGIDWNRDFRLDLVLAGPGGVRLFLQASDGTFRDATADAAGTTEALNADCFGAWTADLEMDGDLDLPEHRKEVLDANPKIAEVANKVSAMLDVWMRGALIPIVVAVSVPDARDAYRDYGNYRRLAEHGMETSACIDRVVHHRTRSPWDNYDLVTYSFKTIDGQPRTATSRTDTDTGKNIRPGQSIRIIYVPAVPATTTVSLAQAWIRFRDQAYGCGIALICLIGLTWSVYSAFRKKVTAPATAV
jgi:hypothetical protein